MNVPAPANVMEAADVLQRCRLLEALCNTRLRGADELLLEALEDPVERVSRRAAAVLLHRYPWLLLTPTPARPLPVGPAAGFRFARDWSRLRRSVAGVVHRPEWDPNLVADRLETVPGLLPVYVEALAAAGRFEQARSLERGASAKSKRPGALRQIMVAPTYACALDCSYCYAKGWARRHGGAMNLPDFKALVLWCRDQSINWMILCGGEPTQHPQFGLLVREAGRAGIQVSLASSGVFGPEIRRSIQPPNVPEFVCHVDPEVLRRHPRWVPALHANLAATVAAGVDVRIRYTLTSRSDATERLSILGLAKRFGVRKVHYGFAFQNVDGTNESFDHNQVPGAFDRVLNSFMDEAKATGVGLHLSKPFPLCDVRRATLRRMALEGGLRSACPAHRRGYTQNLTVNPDLSTQPCNAIGRPGPRITEFPDLAAAGAHHRRLLQHLYERPWRPKCLRCVLHYRGICQGVCLAEHQFAVERSAPQPPVNA